MGDWIEGEIGEEGRQVAIGKGITQTTQSTSAWREFVQRDLSALGSKVMILLIAVMVLFFLGGIGVGLVIREFDIVYDLIRDIDRRLPYVPPEYYYPGPFP